MKTKKNKHTKSWTPRRYMHIYCSPACGGTCTWQQYKLVTGRAARVAESLGDNWKPVIWENLGWHWNVESPCGHIKVRGDGKHFAASISRSVKSAGGTWHGVGNTPSRAIARAYSALLADQSELNIVANACRDSAFDILPRLNKDATA